MSSPRIGQLLASLSLGLCLITCANAATADVVGWPTVTLPGQLGATLTGITMEYYEPDFLKVNKTIDAYLGVPFAQPPVGDLRFEDPVPKKIIGDYNATADKDECPQMSPVDGIPVIGPVLGRHISEDCLYLSIYTPSPKPDTPVPVLVWIHGGGYAIGGGSELLYEPLPLVALSDIIVVNVNYRLGVFGFMTTGDDVATGNYGMMDQVLALQWTKDNIEAFGGDPNRVTIAGESAGGGSVSLHMLSPLSRGLFQQNIMQSGNAACPWAWTTMENAVKAHSELAENVGCSTTDSQAMVACLRDVDADDLIREQITMGNGALSSPVVDGDFLPKDPVEMIKRGLFQVLPTLMGTNEDELSSSAMAVFPGSILDEEPPVMNISVFRSLIPGMVYYAKTPIEVAAVEHHYIDWSVADNDAGDQLDGFIRLGTDQTFSCPTEFYARALEAAGAEVYRYEMTHDPSWSVYAGIPKWLGATHAEDLQYVFAWGLNPTLDFAVGQTDEEIYMSIQFMRYWSNFVISGNPNEPMPSPEYPLWPMYTMPDQEYKKLSLGMDNDRAMRAASCALWLNYMPGLHIQAAPIEDVYDDWQQQYGLWRDTDMPAWTEEFEEYKEENACPASNP